MLTDCVERCWPSTGIIAFFSMKGTALSRAPILHAYKHTTRVKLFLMLKVLILPCKPRRLQFSSFH